MWYLISYKVVVEHSDLRWLAEELVRRCNRFSLGARFDDYEPTPAVSIQCGDRHDCLVELLILRRTGDMHEISSVCKGSRCYR